MKKLLLFLVAFLIQHVCYSQKQGMEKIDSLFQALSNSIKDTSQINTLYSLASEFQTFNPDTAIYFANEGLALAIKLNDKLGIAGGYLWRGAAIINLEKYEEAFKNLNEALSLYDTLLASGKTSDKSKTTKQKAMVYHNIGIVKWYQGNYPEALTNFFAALNIQKETGNKKGIASAYNNIGNIYESQGNYSEALKNYLASLKMREEIGDKKGIADSYNNIGLIYKGQGNYNEALKYYFAALKMREEIGDKKGIAASLNSIGNINNFQGNYPVALKYYLASLKIREAIRDKKGAAAAYNNIGLVYWNQDNYSEALKNYFVGLKIQNEIGDKDGVALSYISIGNIYLKQKKNSDAFKYLNIGIPIAKEVGSLDNIKEGYGALAELDSALGNFKQSLEHYKMYIIYRDSLFNEENAKKIVQSQMQYDFDKKESMAKAEQEKKDVIALKELQKQKLVRNGFVGGFAISILFAGVFLTQRNKIKKGKKRSDELLLNILPAEVAEELKQNGSARAKQFDDVTVMFTDFKDFSHISELLSPSELVEEIHTCFKAFDEIIGKYNIEKIKTIGDSYMCAGGLPVENKTNANDVVLAAIEIRDFMLNRKTFIHPGKTNTFEIRIGIHTGPVVAGIVGIKKFAYDIWGDTVNIASRMESSGEAGKVNISETTYKIVNATFKCVHRGKVQAKNKGEIDMYFVEPII